MKSAAIHKTLWTSCKWPICLILISFLLSLAFYLFLLFTSTQENQRTSKIVEQSLIASINQHEYLPALLAADSTVVNVLLNNRNHELTANKKLSYAATRADADAIFVMNLKGKVVATSNYQHSKSFLHKNYGFRPYFTQAISESKRQFYYAKGATTGIPGFFIASPVIFNGQVIGVVVVKITMAHWEKNWDQSSENIITADENNIIILSSKNQWRYRSIGELSPVVLKKVKQQKQFGNSQHESIYTKSFEINLFNQTSITFWLIDHTLYISYRYVIPEINWTLFSLISHGKILYSSIVFFFIVSMLSLSFYLIRRERQHRLAVINRTRQLEMNRKEELKAVIDNIHIGVLLFPESGELLSINDHARHLFFDGKLPLNEKTIYIHEMVNIDFTRLDSLLLNDVASPAYHEAYAFHHKENIPIMFALSKLTVMERPLYLMTVVNITRRKHAENELVHINNTLEDTITKRTSELEKAQATLIQKNKAAALGNMAATIVHELSQPLTAMNSSIAAVCAKIDNNDWDGASQSANRLNHLSEKMDKVIKLLKYFSYKDNQSNDFTDLEKIIKDTLDIYKDTFKEKGVSLHYQGVTTPTIIRANPLKLDLVISNIIKNAIDASESHQQPSVNIHMKKTDDDKALITITDNGHGVDEKIMGNMFNPYFTTKEVGKGLGLGLSITYEIIQEYGGTITVNNINDGNQTGACFTISLPIFNSEKYS